MKKGMLFGICFLFILIVLLSVVSAGFFSDLFRGRITGEVIVTEATIGADGWTNWLNRDGPGGSGDYESKANFDGLCDAPEAIEVRIVGSETSFSTTLDAPQFVSISKETGFSCLNEDNPDGCYDYEVRFKCPTSTSEPACGNGVIEGGEECDDGNTDSGDGCSSGCLIETGSCTDSDVTGDYPHGKNYYEKGKYSGYGDFCSFNSGEENILLEYYCSYDAFGNPIKNYTKYNCSIEGKICDRNQISSTYGACVGEETPTNETEECIDSDGGYNIYQYGKVSFGLHGSKDCCLDSASRCIDSSDSRLKEATCKENPERGDYSKWNYVDCPNGCVGGACVGEETGSCTDSDGGIVLSKKGIITNLAPGEDFGGKITEWEDVCKLDNYGSHTSQLGDKTLSEGFCSSYSEYGHSKNFYCKYGCGEGACKYFSPDQEVTQRCTDNDDGLDFYVKGEVTQKIEGQTFKQEDRCVMPQQIPENLGNGIFYFESGDTYYYTGFSDDFCEGDDCYVAEAYCDSSGQFQFGLEQCLYGCENGACVEEEEPTDVNSPEECTTGCYLDKKCYNVGSRKSGDYCGEDLEFAIQKKADMSCEDNFECLSNVCLDGGCVEASIWKKFLKWFRRFFGGGNDGKNLVAEKFNFRMIEENAIFYLKYDERGLDSSDEYKTNFFVDYKDGSGFGEDPVRTQSREDLEEEKGLPFQLSALNQEQYQKSFIVKAVMDTADQIDETNEKDNCVQQHFDVERNSEGIVTGFDPNSPENCVEGGKPLSVDLKINGKDFPAPVLHKSILDVSWQSEGDVTHCNGFGSWAPTADRENVWSGLEGNLPASGNIKLMAAFVPEGDLTQIAFSNNLEIGIQCWDSFGESSVEDNVSVSVYKKPLAGTTSVYEKPLAGTTCTPACASSQTCEKGVCVEDVSTTMQCAMVGGVKKCFSVEKIDTTLDSAYGKLGGGCEDKGTCYSFMVDGAEHSGAKAANCVGVMQGGAVVNQQCIFWYARE